MLPIVAAVPATANDRRDKWLDLLSFGIWSPGFANDTRSNGAWYDILDPADPKSLEIHGNPNAVTNDIGTSSLAQGPSANSCLVEAERYDSDLPPLKVFSLPAIIERQDAGLAPSEGDGCRGRI